MRIRSVSVVYGSDVTKSDTIWEWVSSCGDITWGDADGTLVGRDRMLEMIREIEDDFADPDDPDAMSDIREVIKRLESLPPDCYIDLEN